MCLITAYTEQTEMFYIACGGAVEDDTAFVNLKEKAFCGSTDQAAPNVATSVICVMVDEVFDSVTSLLAIKHVGHVQTNVLK